MYLRAGLNTLYFSEEFLVMEVRWIRPLTVDAHGARLQSVSLYGILNRNLPFELKFGIHCTALCFAAVTRPTG